jgi:hypothetical protein
VRLQVDGEAEFLGFAYTQFALPVVAGPKLDFDFNPAPNLRSPPVLGMLLARVGRRHVWLAPLDQPHEQVIAVVDGTLRWGWHGDLDDVPPGLTTTLGIFEGDSVGEVLERWSGAVRAGQPRRRRAANAVTSHLSYWTDNGAAYWYRTEPGRSIGTSVADAWRFWWPTACRFVRSNWTRGAISMRCRVPSPRSAIPKKCRHREC